MKRISVLVMFTMIMVLGAGICPKAEAKDSFKLGVSIYAGWMPWYYAKEAKIIDKWAAARGIKVEIVYMDYIPSIEAYVAEQVDACVMTNMECLDMPAASGIDSTAVIMGDFSNGNDAVDVRDGLKLEQFKGKDVFLVENSVSHYLLARALESVKLKESDVKITNTSDSDIGPAFIANEDQKICVTWNPIVMQIEQVPGVTRVFDSSKIPGEILDLCVVNTKVLKENPKFGEVLVGCWYELMGLMQQRGAESDKAMAKMAKLAGCTAVEFKNQLKTTAMFWTAKSAAEYTKGAEIKTRMDSVRQFCFAHGLLGSGAKSVDAVGIQYPDGAVQGDKANITFRFDAALMETAANGALVLK